MALLGKGIRFVQLSQTYFPITSLGGVKSKLALSKARASRNASSVSLSDSDIFSKVREYYYEQFIFSHINIW